MASTCDNCQFLGSDYGPDAYQCLQTVPPPNAVTAVGMFPTVDLAWWCGQWAAWAATLVEIVAGDNQEAPADEPVPVLPSVKVTDASGRAVYGVEVEFAVESGDGKVTGEIVETGHDGIATVGGWTLGGAPGPNSLSATAEGPPPVTITATGT